MTLLLDKSLREYVELAASDAPAPGGGSVAALAGTLGSCMAAMAGRFTVGKPKYAQYDAEVSAMLKVLDAERLSMAEGVDEDARAFTALGDSYRLPKATDEEKAARQEAINKALMAAMAAPLAVMRSADRAAACLPRLAEVGNPNLVSDTAVAALLLESAARAARINVLVNAGILGGEVGKGAADEAWMLLERTGTAAQTALKTAANRLFKDRNEKL